MSVMEIKVAHDKLFFWLIVGIVLFWSLLVWLNSQGANLAPSGDYQRDTAITYNILAGNVLGDPAYKGEHAWYPFLMHTVFALTHRITNIPVQTLFAKYSILISLPSIVLFLLCFYAMYRSYAYTALALFSLLFLVPWTSDIFHLISHPLVLGFGFLILGIYLFWRAVTINRWLDWILAGIGISLVIYTQTIAALTLCGGIVLYQLANRKHWKKFFLMVIISTLIVSPYLEPLLIDYHLTPRNTLIMSFTGTLYGASLREALDSFFYGYGNLRWVNSFFVITGIVIALLRKKTIDSIIICLFAFSLFIELTGVAILNGILPKYLPLFAPHDFQIVNHMLALFLLCSGIWYWIQKISSLVPQRTTSLVLILLVGFLSFNTVVLLPSYLNRIAHVHANLLSGNQKEPDWYELSKWVLNHADINDVFLASPDRSFFYVSGLTGRKVVVNSNNHANAFVDQDKRIEDYILLYQTTDREQFRNLAKKYEIDYVIVSPYEGWFSAEGLAKFSNDPFFTEVFSSGSVKLYAVTL